MTAWLVSLAKVGGVTALTVGVFYLLYRQLLSLRIFAKMGSTQTFFTVGLVAVLVWLTAMTALLRTDEGVKSLIIGSGNQVTQGATTGSSK